MFEFQKTRLAFHTKEEMIKYRILCWPFNLLSVLNHTVSWEWENTNYIKVKNCTAGQAQIKLNLEMVPLVTKGQISEEINQ